MGKLTEKGGQIVKGRPFCVAVVEVDDEIISGLPNLRPNICVVKATKSSAYHGRNDEKRKTVARRFSGAEKADECIPLMMAR